MEGYETKAVGVDRGVEELAPEGATGEGEEGHRNLAPLWAPGDDGGSFRGKESVFLGPFIHSAERALHRVGAQREQHLVQGWVDLHLRAQSVSPSRISLASRHRAHQGQHTWLTGASGSENAMS